MKNKTKWMLIAFLAGLAINLCAALEIGEHIVFDFSHRGVVGCSWADTVEMAKNICKQKFNTPGIDVSIRLISYDPKYDTDFWGARTCTVDARANCQIIGLPDE